MFTSYTSWSSFFRMRAGYNIPELAKTYKLGLCPRFARFWVEWESSCWVWCHGLERSSGGFPEGDSERTNNFSWKQVIIKNKQSIVFYIIFMWHTLIIYRIIRFFWILDSQPKRLITACVSLQGLRIKSYCYCICSILY